MRRMIISILIFTSTGAAFSPVVQGQPVKKSLVIAIDGLRADCIAPAVAPNLDRLIAEGAFSLDAQCEDLTFSGPNHSSILHGVHRDRHRVTTNDYSGNDLTHWPDYLARLEQIAPQLNTYRVLTWTTSHQNQPTGADVAIVHNYLSDGDELVTQDVEQLLGGTHLQYPADPDAIFVFFSDVDTVGHAFGFDPAVAPYLGEIADTDLKIGRLINAMSARANYSNESWQIVVTSDHGGNIDGSHHGGQPEKRRIPFIVHGGDVIPGAVFPQPKNVDVARTVFAHYGFPVDPAWNWDGHAVGFSQAGRPPARFNNNLIFNGDGEYDRGFTDWTFDQHISGWDDAGPNGMTLIEYGSPGGWPAPDDPGPADRGGNFFAGGSAQPIMISQEIDVSALQPSIDAGYADFILSGWLGGYASQEDHATVTAVFLHSGGTPLRAVTIGPVTAAQRGNHTGLLYRELLGDVPIQTRRVRIELRSTRSAGTASDGYADNLEFSIRRADCLGDLDQDRSVGLNDLTRQLSEFGRLFDATYEQGDMNGDGAIALIDLAQLLAEYGHICN